MAVNAALKSILDLLEDAQRVDASCQQVWAATTRLQEAATAHPDEQLAPENLQALTDLVSTNDDADRLRSAADALRALVPIGWAAPRARTLQLAHCGRLIAALVAAQDPDRAVTDNRTLRVQLASTLSDLLGASPDAVTLATAPPSGCDSRSGGGGGGGKRCIAELYLLNLQACSCLIADSAGAEHDDAAESAVLYATSVMMGLTAIFRWGPGCLPGATVAAARRTAGGAAGMARAFACMLKPRLAPRGGGEIGCCSGGGSSSSVRGNSSGGESGESGESGGGFISGLYAFIRVMLCRVLPLLVEDEVMSQALAADAQLLSGLAAQLPGSEWPAPAVGGREIANAAATTPETGNVAAVDAAGAIGWIVGRRPRLAQALLRAAPGVVRGLVGLLRLRRGDMFSAYEGLLALQALAGPVIVGAVGGGGNVEAEAYSQEECLAVMSCPEVAADAFWVIRALGPTHCETPWADCDKSKLALVLAIQILSDCITQQGATCPVSPAAAAAAALPLLQGQPAVGAAAMSLMFPSPVPAPMMAAAEQHAAVALDSPGHWLRQGWRLTDPNAVPSRLVFRAPWPAVSFLLQCGVDWEDASAVDALVSRVPDLPRCVSATLQVAGAAAGLLPHPLGPLATAAARSAVACAPGDQTNGLRAVLLLLSRLLNGETLLPLAAALDTCDAAWLAAQAAATQHLDEAVREAADCVLCCIAIQTADSAAVQALLSAAARLGIEGVGEVQASIDRLVAEDDAEDDSTILDQARLGNLIPVMERLADAAAGGGAESEERLAGVCDEWGEPDWEGLREWAAARRRRRELERAGVEGGGASSSTSTSSTSSSSTSSSSRGRDSSGGELAANGGGGEQAASGGGALPAAADSSGGGCTIQSPTSGDGLQHPASGSGDQQQRGRPGKACAVCGAAGAPGGAVLKKCTGCLAVLYCSAACQTQDWKRAGGHRTTCKQLQAQRAGLPAAQSRANT